MKIEKLNLKKAEKAGWEKWEKYGKNRLYFDVKKSDLLDLDFYKTGRISYSHFDGEKISHTEAYKLIGSKVYIDLDTMELHVQSNDEDLIDELVKHEVEKIVDDEEPEEEKAAEPEETSEIAFEAINVEEDEIRVLRNENLEGTLKLIDGSWIFFPDDEQAEPVDYENGDLEEVKDEIRLEYQALADEAGEVDEDE